jgi:hypothetical protein
MVWNDEKNQFDKLKQIDLDAPLSPAGHSLRINADGAEWIYFLQSYPCIRVRAKWSDATDLGKYEGFTCLTDRYQGSESKIDRDPAGNPIFKWRTGVAPLDLQQTKELIKAGVLKREELPCRIVDVDSGKPVDWHGGTVYWNDFRKRYIAIFVQGAGDSFLGEVWYSEADKPEGPWLRAKKIATHVKPLASDEKQHEAMDFYNPVQHPFFDEQNGKIIYFEGTYSNTFSGTTTPTPKYEYNQLMYRLDLSDPRLKLPE